MEPQPARHGEVPDHPGAAADHAALEPAADVEDGRVGEHDRMLDLRSLDMGALADRGVRADEGVEDSCLRADDRGAPDRGALDVRRGVDRDAALDPRPRAWLLVVAG